MSHHACKCETDHVLESRSFRKKIKEMTQRVCVLTIQGGNSPNSLSAWNGRPYKVKFRHESWKVTKTQELGREETLALDRGGSSIEMKKECWDGRSEIRSLKLCDVTHLALLPEKLGQQKRFEAVAI